MPTSADPAYLAWSTADPRPDGGRPVFGPPVHSLEEALAMVASGHGVHLLPGCVAGVVSHVYVVQREVADLPPSPFSICIDRTGAPPVARTMFEVAVVDARAFDPA